MSSSDQEEWRNLIIRSMLVNLAPLSPPQRKSKKVCFEAPPTPELTVEYVRLRNNDDAVTEPEVLEDYIKELRAKNEAKKKQSIVDDDMSTDDLEENHDAVDIIENRSIEEVRCRTASWKISPIQGFLDSPHDPALLSKSPSKHQRVTYSNQTHQSPTVSKSHSEVQRMTDSSPTLFRTRTKSVTDSSQAASTPDHQTTLRRSLRIREKEELRSMNLSRSLLSSRKSRQKKVSRSRSPEIRRTVNTRTIGTQTVDYWFNMLMNISYEYDITPRQQAK